MSARTARASARGVQSEMWVIAASDMTSPYMKSRLAELRDDTRIEAQH